MRVQFGRRQVRLVQGLVNYPRSTPGLRRIPSKFSEVQQADLPTMQLVFTRCSVLYKALEAKLKAMPKDQRKTDAYIALNTAFIGVKKVWTPAREAYNSLRINTGRTVEEMAQVIVSLNAILETLNAIPNLQA